MRTAERNLYRVLSLAVAVALWYMVAADRNPQVERALTVELRARGLAAGLVLVSMPSRVEVRVRGPRSAVAELNADGLEAYVELGQVAEPGEYRVPVRVRAPQGLRLLGVQPEEVVVGVDAVARRQMPVEVVLQGTPAPGAVLGQPSVQPARVTVQGPRSLVQQVQRVWVAVDVTGLRTSLTQSLRVRVEDQNGAELQGVTSQPPNVQVSLPVGEGALARAVPVVPTITGRPRPGLSVALLEASPAVVTIRGPQEAVLNASLLLTEPVDVSAVEGEVRRTVRLRLPPRVRSDSGPTVSVRVVVLPTPVSRELEVALTVRAEPGVEVRVEPATVRVAVVGPKEAVERLQPDQVEAFVTVPPQLPAAGRLPVRVSVPEGLVVAWVDPPEVSARATRR
ncbi:MAG: CdaR family protein [Armatimonadota bacterium]|nr:CdaR family protein [Armatimonadota bacterium]